MTKKVLVSLVFGALVVGLFLPMVPAQAAPSGTLTGWCVDNGSQPYIFLEWGSHPSANSNGLQKRDSFPSDPQNDWGWLSTTGTQRAYTDYAIVRGVAYTYRVKYQPQLPSNEVTVVCPLSSTPTPTPTPVPTLPLYCAPTLSYANSGDQVRFDAAGGNGSYTWTIPGGNPGTGFGSPLFVRFYNYSGVVQSHWITVASGTQSMFCEVRVQPQATITPTPAPSPIAQFTVTTTGRNVTRGQNGEHAAVSGRVGDTIDILVHIRNTSGTTLTNVIVSELLPAGVRPIPGTTTVNSFIVANTLTSSGLTIGSITPYQTTTVKLSVHVDAVVAPGATLFGTVQVRTDGLPLQSAQLPMTFGTSLGTVGQVKTGPMDTFMLALGTAVMATGAYAIYAFSARGQRRLAFAEIRSASGRSLNFSK